MWGCVDVAVPSFLQPTAAVLAQIGKKKKRGARTPAQVPALAHVGKGISAPVGQERGGSSTN